MIHYHFAYIVMLRLLYAGILSISVSAVAQTQVANTPHNLSSKLTRPIGVCITCHTPHNSSPTRGLWNRALPGVTYQLYASSTLMASLDQPSGSSRLCLSCHDGILAMGTLRVPPPGGQLDLGALTGEASLGTDLADDHPISFTYDSVLALNSGDLADPLSLPEAIRLENGQLQCTSCHEPHEDQRPNFLRIDNKYGDLCTSCHRQANWSGSSHATSSAGWNGSGTSPWPDGAYATVSENACINCHRSHTAGHPQRLLAQTVESKNCTVCHNGSVAGKDIEAEVTVKPYAHPVESNQWIHEPNENPSLMAEHVTCVDCHNPHAANSASGIGSPLAFGPLQGVSGISIAGASVTEASFEYEVCLKCHGVKEPLTLSIVRQDAIRNIRLRIDPNNPSYHPFASTGKNPAILGLEPGYTAASIITCTNCHNNDDWTQGGNSPSGSHGSRYEGILWQQYETNIPTTESPATYALCYECHNREFLLADQVEASGIHQDHVVIANAPCAACHDPHGSRESPRLIDFMRYDRTGNAVVTPSSGGLLEYSMTAPGSSSCFLSCHGVDHNPKTYPSQ